MLITESHVTAAIAHEQKRISRYRQQLQGDYRHAYMALRRHYLILAALEVCRDYGAEQLVINRANATMESNREEAQRTADGTGTPSRSEVQGCPGSGGAAA